VQHIMIDDAVRENNCIVCCCDTVSIKPGETLPLQLNYAAWAVPIAPRGLHCEPSVDVEEKDTCPAPTGGNLPPAANGDIRFDVLLNTAFLGDLATEVTDQEGDPLTFKSLALYGPKHGKLELDSDGTFTYTPFTSYKGTDNFFFSVSDGVNSPVIMEALLGVGVPGDSVRPTADLTVGEPIVNQRWFTVTLPIAASPAAKNCQVFRLTVRQGALDCDCNCYYHNDCIDVRIAKC